jgi:hypothetical protein
VGIIPKARLKMKALNISEDVINSVYNYTKWLTGKEAVSEDEALDVFFGIAKITSYYAFGYMKEDDFKSFLSQWLSFGFREEDISGKMVRCLCHPIFIQYKSRTSLGS